jgi:hypothetical protein
MPSAAVRFRVAGLVLLCFARSPSFNAQNHYMSTDLIAHEWGTFTSIAGGSSKAARSGTRS